MGVERLLGHDNCMRGVRGAGEDYEEGVALGADLEAMVCGDGSPHHAALVLEDIGPLVTQFLEQAR